MRPRALCVTATTRCSSKKMVTSDALRSPRRHRRRQRSTIVARAVDETELCQRRNPPASVVDLTLASPRGPGPNATTKPRWKAIFPSVFLVFRLAVERGSRRHATIRTGALVAAKALVDRMPGDETIPAGIAGPQIADHTGVNKSGCFGSDHRVRTYGAGRKIASTRICIGGSDRLDFSECWHRDLLPIRTLLTEVYIQQGL